MTAASPQRPSWSRYATRYVFFIAGLLAMVGFCWLTMPSLALPWRSFSVYLLPDATYQQNKLWQASQQHPPSLAKQIVTLPLQQQPAAGVSLSHFQIAASLERFFCTGDTVLVTFGAQQRAGVLTLKIAAGEGSNRAQLGIELAKPFELPSPTTEQVLMTLRRISYQPGDWRKLKC